MTYRSVSVSLCHLLEITSVSWTRGTSSLKLINADGLVVVASFSGLTVGMHSVDQVKFEEQFIIPESEIKDVVSEW